MWKHTLAELNYTRASTFLRSALSLWGEAGAACCCGRWRWGGGRAGKGRQAGAFRQGGARIEDSLIRQSSALSLPNFLEL